MPSDIIPQRERNYAPLDLKTRYHACLRIAESGWPVRKVLGYYHVKRSSLYRWLKRFDGTELSLADRSHRPHSDHPKAVRGEKLGRVLSLKRRNPDASYLEIWAKMGALSSGIAPITVLRILKRNGEHRPYAPCRKRHDKEYHTPKFPHEKWQMDVKFVPASCRAPGLEGKFYQYTIIDECSRMRCLYYADECSTYETVKALENAVRFFGCLPKEVQTDNGTEFGGSALKKGDAPDLVAAWMESNGVRHHFIRPRTPQHNGKVERSHRTDQDKFYRTLSFFSLGDLRKQGRAWQKRYNDTPKQVLGFKSPREAELAKLRELMETTGEIRCPKRLTSIDS